MYQPKFIGRKIVSTRLLNQEELDFLDWYGVVVVLVLDDGTELVPSRDDEGNGGGAIWHCEAGEFLG